MVTQQLVIDIEHLEEETVRELRRVISEVLNAVSLRPNPAAVQGWTVQSAVELDRRLRVKNRPVQAEVIAAAAHAGGFVDRHTVFALGRYEEGRRLNGLSKPVNRVVREMINEGLIPRDAAHPMTTEYDPAVPSFQKALGFRMPAEVAAVFAEALDNPGATT